MTNRTKDLMRAAGIVGVLSVALAPAHASSVLEPAVARVMVDGDRIAVLVVNPTDEPRVVSVSVTAIVAEGLATVATPKLLLPAHGESRFTGTAAGEVREVIAVGIVLDDGSPFGPS